MHALLISSAGSVGSHLAALVGQSIGALQVSPGGIVQLAALVVVVLLASLFDSM